MSKSPSRRFPVTVTRLPVTRCQLCHQTVAYRPGNLSEVLTGHYRRAHPEALDLASRQLITETCTTPGTVSGLGRTQDDQTCRAPGRRTPSVTKRGRPLVRPRP